jgi:short-subunit dehydrogenase
MPMKSTALIIGNSDGIGLATTLALLKQKWKVIGISRSTSSIHDSFYAHTIAEVQMNDYCDILKSVLEKVEHIDLCIYCVGIGQMLDISDMEGEARIIQVNLLGMVKTVSLVIPVMVEQGEGHIMGLSSVADELLSADAPSYHASKAGFSNYLESLALAVKPKGIQVTNIRFGFVDTKMAKGEVKPFMISVERAVQHLLKCIEKKPVRYTAPGVAIPLVKFRKWMMRLNHR